MSSLEFSAASFPLLTNLDSTPYQSEFRQFIGFIKRLKSWGCSNIVLALVRCTFLFSVNMQPCLRSTFSARSQYSVLSGCETRPLLWDHVPHFEMISFHESHTVYLGLFPHNLTARAILHRDSPPRVIRFKLVDQPFHTTVGAMELKPHVQFSRRLALLPGEQSLEQSLRYSISSSA
jgi:hypothetical protein